MLKKEHTNLLSQKKIINNEFHQLIEIQNLPEGKIKWVQRDNGHYDAIDEGKISVYANKHILFNK